MFQMLKLSNTSVDVTDEEAAGLIQRDHTIINRAFSHFICF